MNNGDATNCMLKLVELDNSHSSRDGVFAMASDKGGRLEILHWFGSFFSAVIFILRWMNSSISKKKSILPVSTK